MPGMFQTGCVRSSLLFSPFVTQGADLEMVASPSCSHLCRALAASLHRKVWQDARGDLERFSRVFDYGSSHLEAALHALERVGAVERVETAGSYRVLVINADFDDFVSGMEFSQEDLDELLSAFLSWEIGFLGRLGPWDEPFEVPGDLAPISELLRDAGYLTLDGPGASWLPPALPWLLHVDALRHEDLPQVDPARVQSAVLTLPDEIRTVLVRHSSARNLYENARFLCLYWSASGWDPDRQAPSWATSSWDVPLIFSVLEILASAESQQVPPRSAL
ncbi:hypothetical protein [Stappia sp. 28M-7]|uniref:hypothetical protein n=1 Tax=Stappia sp. 28M-7 TaxID=2762596 RepID=UPI00163C009F|nr:hypothetical protein [Stappia sp. 28M-7]MBC2858642.1 hypothetical protein [Stappia sp. 28M-7]